MSLRLPAALTEAVATVVALWAIFFWTCKADIDLTTVKLFAVQLIDSFLVVCVVFEFDEAKALAATAFAVSDDTRAGDRTDLLEMSFQRVVSGSVSQATDKQILGCH